MVPLTASRLAIVVASWRPLIASLVQLQVAMCVGAIVCYLLGVLIPRSWTLSSMYYPGAYLYTAGDIFFQLFRRMSTILSDSVFAANSPSSN